MLGRIHLFTAARLVFGTGIDGGQNGQGLSGNLNPLWGNGIMHPLALLASDDNARIAEDLHVVGQGGLADAHFLQQLAGAFLATAEQI